MTRERCASIALDLGHRWPEHGSWPGGTRLRRALIRWQAPQPSRSRPSAAVAEALDLTLTPTQRTCVRQVPRAEGAPFPLPHLVARGGWAGRATGRSGRRAAGAGARSRRLLPARRGPRHDGAQGGVQWSGPSGWARDQACFNNAGRALRPPDRRGTQRRVDSTRPAGAVALAFWKALGGAVIALAGQAPHDELLAAARGRGVLGLESPGARPPT
jgi:hypothetical protein